jgi:hypothetical protein
MERLFGSGIIANGLHGDVKCDIYGMPKDMSGIRDTRKHHGVDQPVKALGKTL